MHDKRCRKSFTTRESFHWSYSTRVEPIRLFLNNIFATRGEKMQRNRKNTHKCDVAGQEVIMHYHGVALF